MAQAETVEPALITADAITYDTEARVVSATGNVEINRAGRRLLADRLTYDLNADRVTAHGNVVVIEPSGEAFFADDFTVTGPMYEGVVEQLRARFTDQSRLAAAAGTREGEITVLDRAVYSPCETCPGEKPLWQLKARRVVHDRSTLDVYYYDARLELLGVPVLYTPFLSHPDPSVERRTGLLVPEVQSDTLLGLSLSVPVYWAIAPNRDLTVTPTVYTAVNPQLSGEYRHLWSESALKVESSVTFAEEGVEDDPGENQLRGHVNGEFRTALNEEWRGGVDLYVASDDSYLQRYDIANLDVLESRAFAERARRGSFVEVNGFGFQGLRAIDEQDQIPVVLPFANTVQVFDDLLMGAEARVRSNLLGLTRNNGLDTYRGSLAGDLIVPRVGRFGDLFTLTGTLRGDLYYLEGDVGSFAENNDRSLQPRLVPRVTLDWSLPLARQGTRLRQTIEPLVQASYAPLDDEPDDIPNEDSREFELDDTNLFTPNRFYGLDRVETGLKLAYGTRFSGQSSGGLRLNGLLGQSFRFFGEPDFEGGSGAEDDLSDIVGRLGVSPGAWLDLDYRFRLDVPSASLPRNEVSLRSGPDYLRLGLTYLSLDESDPDNEEALFFGEREEVNASLAWKINDQWTLTGRARRDLAASEPIRNAIGIAFRNECLIFAAGIERDFTDNRDAEASTTIAFRIALRNLGEAESNSRFGAEPE